MNVKFERIVDVAPELLGRLVCGHDAGECDTPAVYYMLARINGVWMWDGTCVCSSEECAAKRLTEFDDDAMEPWDVIRPGRN